MELTEIERTRWEAFKKTYSRDKTKIERVKKIKDIYSEAEGLRGDLTEIRARRRRQGAY